MPVVKFSKDSYKIDVIFTDPGNNHELLKLHVKSFPMVKPLTLLIKTLLHKNGMN